MTITVGDAATSGEKELKTDYPIEEGLVAGTTKQTGKIMNLIPEGVNGVKSTILKNDTRGVR